ncbi:MAG: phosphatidylserine decarboxylase family protein, partial [Rikenellaceae bacterium]|nr:phosphatidylserine decarboxylase family protein [Rikenellaceae bacterium]
MTLSKEGRAIMLSTLAACVAVSLAAWFLIFPPLSWLVIAAAVLFLLFIVRFFRLPHIEHEVDDTKVFSPAYGTVVVVERVYEEEYFKCDMMQVSVFMSVWDVHANWFPVSGTVRYFRHHHGKYMVAWHPKSSTDNERTSIVVESIHATVLFRQIAGILAKRIVSYAREGSQYSQSDKCGFIKFGSRVDVFLPLDTRITVNIGDKVKGGQSVIACFD